MDDLQYNEDSNEESDESSNDSIQLNKWHFKYEDEKEFWEKMIAKNYIYKPEK